MLVGNNYGYQLSVLTPHIPFGNVKSWSKHRLISPFLCHLLQLAIRIRDEPKGVENWLAREQVSSELLRILGKRDFWLTSLCCIPEYRKAAKAKFTSHSLWSWDLVNYCRLCTLWNRTSRIYSACDGSWNENVGLWMEHRSLRMDCDEQKNDDVDEKTYWNGVEWEKSESKVVWLNEIWSYKVKISHPHKGRHTKA